MFEKLRQTLKHRSTMWGTAGCNLHIYFHMEIKEEN